MLTAQHGWRRVQAAVLGLLSKLPWRSKPGPTPMSAAMFGTGSYIKVGSKMVQTCSAQKEVALQPSTTAPAWLNLAHRCLWGLMTPTVPHLTKAHACAGLAGVEDVQRRLLWFGGCYSCATGKAQLQDCPSRIGLVAALPDSRTLAGSLASRETGWQAGTIVISGVLFPKEGGTSFVLQRLSAILNMRSNSNKFQSVAVQLTSGCTKTWKLALDSLLDDCSHQGVQACICLSPFTGMC